MAKKEKAPKAAPKKEAKAKKPTPEKKKKAAPKAPLNQLPQNILPIGERVLESKNIYISQPVYREIHRFTRNKTTNESGGVLVGTVIEEFGKTNILISAFVEAKYCDATPTTLKFTHHTWEYIHEEIDKRFPKMKILGWIHTHPDFGIFLSEYDTFIHENYFSGDHQVAYVVDPIQNQEGFYFWIDGKLQKCGGFYLYDKPGRELLAETEKEDPVPVAAQSLWSQYLRDAVLAVLALAVMFLAISNNNLKKEVTALEAQQQADHTWLGEIENNNFALYQAINNLYDNLAPLFPQDTETTEGTEASEGAEGAESTGQEATP